MQLNWTHNKAERLLKCVVFHSETFNQTFYNDSEYRWRQRSYTLNFTYRFNQKKNQNRRQMRSGGYEDGSFDF